MDSVITADKVTSLLEHEIADLSPVERERLYDALAFNVTQDTTAVTHFQRSIFMLAANHCDRAPPLDVFLRGYGKLKFVAAIDSLKTFASESCARKQGQSHLAALIDLTLRCLASDLRARLIPVSPKTLFDNVGSAASAVDQRFPGYARSKALAILVGEHSLT